MLTFKDFFHLPQLDPLIEKLVADEPGLTVVAGLDPRPQATLDAGEGFLPSGRAAIFRILARQMLTARRLTRAVVVAESKDAVRVPRRLGRRVEFSLVRPPLTYADCLAAAVRRRPGLLVVDRLCAETAPAALGAAQSGLRVLSQMDTIFRGADVARALRDLGAPLERLDGLRWVVAVQRLPALCPHCKQPSLPDSAQLTELRRRFPEVLQDEEATFFAASGCDRCRHTGRHGDVAAFDVFCAHADAPNVLPLEEYVLRLALMGLLSVDDVLWLERDQLRRTYSLLVANEGALREANRLLERKLAELEAANRVLEQRTGALISLQEVGQALIASTELDNLAVRVCRHVCDLCGADRAILYFLRSPDTAEVLAADGWDPSRLPRLVAADQVFEAGANAEIEPVPFNRWPPGIPPRSPDVEGVALRAGLRVALIAQEMPVGAMIVHSTQKTGFAPGEVALLQTFAQQAALAIQRAGLIAELVKKERMERELELAREVQQSVLPRTFPPVLGYAFAVRNEPARQVGGDLYDVFPLDADRIGLVIADVSDKGMPAALYMALTRSLLLAEARRERSPRAVLTNVHRLLLELGRPNMFVTVFYGVVERATRRLTYARAGHDWPLMVRGSSVQTLRGSGTFLGFPDLDDLHLSEEQVELAPGDRLVLYTDGLTDALNPEGQPFGRDRLGGLLLSNAHLSPDELCRTTFAHLAEYQGTAEQYDDMTMLVVEVK